MPKHTYWFTYVLDKLPALKQNAQNMGHGLISGFQGQATHPDYKATEPVITAFLYMVILLLLALYVRKQFLNVKQSVIPSEKLTLATAFEVFFGYFYQLCGDVMGSKEAAKKYFPLIGASAAFIVFSNVVGLIPGVSSPTSSLNVTLGCSVVVFIAFNYYGLKENGWAYLKHFAGPVWYLSWLMLPIELFSTFVRVITLSVRLMVNIAVDHLLAALFIGMVALFVPIPITILGLLVCVVQTLVFCLLAAVYIGLATEKHEHDHGPGHGHAAHAH